MTLPTNYPGPRVAHPRRYLWLAERERTRLQLPGPAIVFHARRLEVSGTTLPTGFPYRALLLTAGVLAVEEVLGASVDELRTYGLTLRQAETLALWTERLSLMNTFSYSPRAGQAYDEDEVLIIASTTATASYTSAIYEVGDRTTLRLLLALTAISGTSASVQVQIQTREAYASGTWRTVDGFGPLTATASQYRTMSGLDRFVRAVVTIAGSGPSTTLALTGTAN